MSLVHSLTLVLTYNLVNNARTTTEQWTTLSPYTTSRKTEGRARWLQHCATLIALTVSISTAELELTHTVTVTVTVTVTAVTVTVV